MSQSAEKVELEVEKSRARLNRTLDDLRSRWGPSFFDNQFGGLDRRITSVHEAAGDLLSFTRKNPIPISMIGVGIAWLLYEAFASGKRGQSSRLAKHKRVTERPTIDRKSFTGTIHREAGLDEAVEETFPSSDPVAVQFTR